MTLPLPIRLDRVQKALYDVLTDALDTAGGGPVVSWSYNEASFEGNVPDAGIVSLTMIGGPSPFNRAGRRGTLLNAASAITVTVDAAEVGRRYILRLNGFDYLHDAVVGDTVTTIRDSLLGQLDEPAASGVANGADSIDLSADSLGGLRSLQLVGPLSSSGLVVDGRSVLVVDGEQTMLVNIQAYSKGREPRNGAWALMARVYAALQSEDYVETLRRFGVGLWGKGVSTDLSAVVGAHWETRVSMDLTIAARSTWVRPIDRIESVDGTFNTSTFTVNAP